MSSLRLNQIVADDDIQPRAKGLDTRHVEELADAVRAGAKLPSVVVYDVGDAHLLSEGFHRYAAYTLLKKTHIPCEVRRGTREECKLNALASNQGHGLKRTNADKLRALHEVAAMQPKWSDGKIAEFIGVSRNFVAENRPQVLTVSTSDAAGSEKQTGGQVSSDDNCPPGKRVGKDGKLYPAAKPKPTKTSQSEPTTADPEPAAEPVEVVSPTATPDSTEPVIEPADVSADDSVQADTEDASEAFCGELNALCRELDAIGVRVAALKGSPYGRFVHWQSAKDQIKNGRETLWQGRPNHVCPYCRKAGEVQPACKCCGGLNVCTRDSYKRGAAAVGGVDE